jgi:hypothetical protein
MSERTRSAIGLTRRRAARCCVIPQWSRNLAGRRWQPRRSRPGSPPPRIRCGTRSLFRCGALCRKPCSGGRLQSRHWMNWRAIGSATSGGLVWASPTPSLQRPTHEPNCNAFSRADWELNDRDCPSRARGGSACSRGTEGLQTRRWRGESAANSSLKLPNSLLAGKIQGISPIRGLAAPGRPRKRTRNQFLTRQFPTHPNREFFEALQGI